MKFKETTYFKVHGAKATLVSFELDNYFLITGELVNVIPEIAKGISVADLNRHLSSESIQHLISYFASWGLLEGSEGASSPAEELNLVDGSIKSVVVVIEDYQIYAVKKAGIEM